MKTFCKLVWLIDDNEIDNFINKKIILKSNFALDVKDFNSASLAEDSLNRLMENTENEIPDYVFLDLNMPVFSGIDFLKRCEEKLKNINPNIKVVILTSSVNPHDEYISSLFGSFYAYLNKPLSVENLEKLSE